MSHRLNSIVQQLHSTPTMFHNLGVIFIVGGGPRIGYAVANSFYQKGYKVAIASRTPYRTEIEKRGWFPIEMDLLSHDAIHKGFEQVRARIGEPNVVVYNGAALTFAPDDDIFSISGEQFQKRPHCQRHWSVHMPAGNHGVFQAFGERYAAFTRSTQGLHRHR